MKVAIIGITDLFNMPYYKTYEAILEEQGIKFDIINWSRRNLEGTYEDNQFTFKYPLNDLVPIYKKIIPMLKYASFLKQTITRNNYDFLIILSPLISVLMSSFLMKKYEGRYLVDIRDYTYESIRVYREIEKKVLMYARMNVISSPGFRKFIPNDDLIVCHNMTYESVDARIIQNRGYERSINKPITIGYIGLIQYIPQVKRFITSFSNDERFLIKICGEGSEVIQEYCENNGIFNVQCSGRYLPEEKQIIYSTFDVVFNAYGNGIPLLDYALSNKLYESAWNRLPIIVNEGTMMEEYAGYMGYPIKGGTEPHENDLSEKFLQWYLNIDWLEFDKAAINLLTKSIDENNLFKRELITSLDNSKNIKLS